jgi:hypothetical protein
MLRSGMLQLADVASTIANPQWNSLSSLSSDPKTHAARSLEQQHVHMVRHDDPSVQLIQLPTLVGANRIHHLPRDSRIAEPSVPMALGHRTILYGERMTGSRIDDVRRRHVTNKCSPSG